MAERESEASPTFAFYILTPGGAKFWMLWLRGERSLSSAHPHSGAEGSTLVMALLTILDPDHLSPNSNGDLHQER